jgi:hypothetical protein
VLVDFCVGDGSGLDELGEELGLTDGLELAESESDGLALADELALAEEVALGEELADAELLAVAEALPLADLTGDAAMLPLALWLAEVVLLSLMPDAVSSALFGSVEQAVVTIGGFAAVAANASPVRLMLTKANPASAPSAAGMRIWVRTLRPRFSNVPWSGSAPPSTFLTLSTANLIVIASLNRHRAFIHESLRSFPGMAM